MARQEAIKELGTNGGGFFNANSAHPFENPTGITNWLEIWLLLVIPFSLPYTFGKMVGDHSQGWVVSVDGVLFWRFGRPLMRSLEARTRAVPPQTTRPPAATMEGKEIRFGPGDRRCSRPSTTLTSDRRGRRACTTA